jgi:hypothetical protein
MHETKNIRLDRFSFSIIKIAEACPSAVIPVPATCPCVHEPGYMIERVNFTTTSDFFIPLS